MKRFAYVQAYTTDAGDVDGVSPSVPFPGLAFRHTVVTVEEPVRYTVFDNGREPGREVEDWEAVAYDKGYDWSERRPELPLVNDYVLEIPEAVNAA